MFNQSNTLGCKSSSFTYNPMLSVMSNLIRGGQIFSSFSLCLQLLFWEAYLELSSLWWLLQGYFHLIVMCTANDILIF